MSHPWKRTWVHHEIRVSSPGSAPRQAVGNDTHHRGERLGSKPKEISGSKHGSSVRCRCKKKTENAFTSIARTGVGWPSTFRWHHGRLTTSLQIAAHLVLDVSIAWPARNSCHHLRAGPARAAAYCPHTVSPNQPRPWLSHTQIARRLLCRRTAGARTWSNFYSVSCSLSGFGQVSRRSRTRRRFQQFNHASTFATARCRRFHRRFKFNGIRLHGSK